MNLIQKTLKFIHERDKELCGQYCNNKKLDELIKESTTKKNTIFENPILNEVYPYAKKSISNKFKIHSVGGIVSGFGLAILANYTTNYEIPKIIPEVMAGISALSGVYGIGLGVLYTQKIMFDSKEIIKDYCKDKISEYLNENIENYKNN
jgi:hypothetical protein